MTTIGLLPSALSTNQTDWKEKAEKAKKTLEEQDKQEALRGENNYNLEDVYVPSYSFNNTGADYYSENWSSQDFWDINNHYSDSLEQFTINLKKTIVEDYRKQNPDSDFMCESDGTMGGTPSLKLTNYLKSIDYKKEYEEYKQSRGCSTDEELRALNSVFTKSKDDLLTLANSYMGGISDSLQNEGFLSQQFFDDKINQNSILKQLNLQDIADFLYSQQTAHNFKERASSYQAFTDFISQQDNIDPKAKNIFARISNEITNSKGAIAAFSDEIEKMNAKELSAKSQYNATLIAQYDS